MRRAADIVLLSEERAQLLQLARSKTVSVRLARRAQIVLGAADGLDNHTIAAQVGVGRVQVGRWRNRYIEGGLAAIQQDLPRGGRPVKADAAQIVRLTTQTLPANATQWSTPRYCECGASTGSSRIGFEASKSRAIRSL